MDDVLWGGVGVGDSATHGRASWRCTQIALGRWIGRLLGLLEVLWPSPCLQAELCLPSHTTNGFEFVSKALQTKETSHPFLVTYSSVLQRPPSGSPSHTA